MIAVQDIGIQFAGRVLFRDLAFVIRPKERIALVGPNGAGKTTLLRLLAGQLAPDTGRIVRARSVRVGYLPQEGVAAAARTVFAEVEAAFAGVLDLRQRLDDLGEALATLEPGSPDHLELLDRMGDLQLRLDQSGAARIRPRIETVLQGLGFRRDDLDRPCAEFSGGWQMRIALAKLLLEEPDLLLLDEPTNHLDLGSLRWVEKYLQAFRGGIVLISHDRSFLDSLARRTLAFTRGKVEDYSGNYSFYERESVARREQLEKAFANQQREIGRTQRFIDRFRAKNTKATQVQSRIKMLEKLERIELDREGPQIRFAFPPAPPGGRLVARFEKVSMRYGDLGVLEDFDFSIDKDDRIAVVGVNGAGKSTFSRLVSLREAPTAGTVVHGFNVRPSHFAQDQAEELDPRLTALETLERVDTGGAPIDRRSVLGCFLFRGDDVFKPVAVLSGGEKSRLALARMLLHPSNFLVLDEPTNHLDMASQARLQGALLDYQGAFVIVSHNRDFLDPLVNKVLEFRAGLPPRLYLGNVSDYLDQVEQEEQEAGARQQLGETDNVRAKGEPSGTSSRREQRRLEARRRDERNRMIKPLRERLAALEQAIAGQEAEKAELTARLDDPATFGTHDTARVVLARFAETEALLEAAYREWHDLAEQIEAIEAEADA